MTNVPEIDIGRLVFASTLTELSKRMLLGKKYGYGDDQISS